MKSKILLLSIATSLISLSASAQDDITPSSYIFANQPVGQYKINATVAGANPAAAWTTPVDNFNNGYLAIAGGAAVFTALDAVQPAAIQTGLNIVDMGGQVGKVLVLRGKSSTYNVGTPMGAGYAGSWFNLNFYFDKTKTPNVAEFVTQGYSTAEATVKATVRVRMVFSIAENVISATGSLLSKFYTSNWQNNTSPALANVPALFPSDVFQATDANGDPIPNDNGEAYYDPTKWMVYEFDTTVPETTGNPNRLKIEIAATAGAGTLLIKELKFSKNVTGTPVMRQAIKLTPGTTGLFNQKTSALKFVVNNNRVTLVNLPASTLVNVYTMSGLLTKSSVFTETNNSFELASGLYIIKAANKVAKVSIN